MKSFILASALAVLLPSALLAQTQVGSITVVVQPGQQATLEVAFHSAWENAVGVRDQKHNLLGVWNNQNGSVPQAGKLSLPKNESKEVQIYLIEFNHKEGSASPHLAWKPSVIKLHYKLANTFFWGGEDGGDATYLDAQVKVHFADK